MRATTSRSLQSDINVTPLVVKDDGTVYIDTLVIRREELPAALKRLRATEALRPIAVRADKRVAYGDVAGVLGACRDAGWENVSLVSSPRASATGGLQP